MSTTPVIRVQADVTVPPGRTAHSDTAGSSIHVAYVAWVAYEHGVALYAHGQEHAAHIPAHEQHLWPHPGPWFDELATQIAAGGEDRG